MSELNNHAVLLRMAARTAGVPASVVAPKCLGEDDRPEMILRLTFEAGTIYFSGLTLYWANTAGGIGKPVNGESVGLAKDKHRTKQVLSEAGIPTPRGAVFRADDLAATLTYAAECTGEICVKPNCGSMGDLVFPYLREANDIAEACLAVAAVYDEVLVEESLPGESWRYFYVRPNIVAVKLGRPASVLGDGARTVAALIEAANAERARRASEGHQPILEGHALAFMLKRQGMTMASVPPSGHRVFLHLASNGPMGADSVFIPGAIHPDYARWVMPAFEAFPDLLVGAVDLIIHDPMAAPTHDNFHVLEINTSPFLQPYHYPWEGPSQDVCGPIIGLLRSLPRQ